MVIESKEIEIPVKERKLAGTLNTTKNAEGIIVFAHGSGSSRHSPRNKFIAKVLQHSGFSTLMFDLLTVQEDQDYSMRFDIQRISDRLIKATEWLKLQPVLAESNFGYFGASTGAAAALSAAAQLGDVIKAVVSRGGRPDLAADVLPRVKAPTLLLVGSLDNAVINLNQQAYNLLTTEKELVIIEGATHLFEETGKLEEVGAHASNWFSKHLKKAAAQISFT